MSGRCAVLTACDVAYAVGARALLESVRRHHPDVDRICVVPASQLAQLSQTLGATAKVVAAPRHIPGIVDRLQIAHGKLFVSEFPEYDWIVWADSDVVFCRPAPELFEPRGEKAVAVRSPPAHRVPNNLPVDLRDRFVNRFREISQQPGFNGGLFALAPRRWPDLISVFHRMLVELECENHPGYFDQPLLNVMFADNLVLLDPRFNWTDAFEFPPTRATRVVHFCSHPKPWMPGFPKHEPLYYVWLKHGLAETNRAKLGLAKLRILMRTPRRLISRRIRC